MRQVHTSESQNFSEETVLKLLQELGYAKQSITQAEHIYLLSERGYTEMYICGVPKWKLLSGTKRNIKAEYFI